MKRVKKRKRKNVEKGGFWQNRIVKISYNLARLKLWKWLLSDRHSALRVPIGVFDFDGKRGRCFDRFRFVSSIYMWVPTILPTIRSNLVKNGFVFHVLRKQTRIGRKWFLMTPNLKNSIETLWYMSKSSYSSRNPPQYSQIYTHIKRFQKESRPQAHNFENRATEVTHYHHTTKQTKQQHECPHPIVLLAFCKL